MAKKKGGPKTGKKSKHRFSFKEKAAAPEKPSPFAIRSGKLKFDILGRKVKGDKGNVVKAREAGHTKRKNTLLKEYEASGKSNAFIDRRFGEDDASMTPEERAIGRLARTRLRQIKRGSGYNLNDGSDDDGPDYYDDEGPITLTHGGKPIDEREEERRSAHAIARGRSLRRNDDDSDDDMNMDAATTGALHFGGGDDDDEFEPTLKRGDHDAPAEADGDTNDADDERRKTKKEVMDELIDKSKYHKAERAKQRERDEDLLDKLDDEFKEISGAGLFRAALSKGVGHLKPDGWERGKKNGAKDAAKDANKGTSSVLEKKMTASAKEALALAAVATDARGGAIKDDYDRLTRELVLESRGQATDRMRTNEEVDAAEAAALETAERARLKRMNAVDSDDDGISDDDMGPSSGGYAARRAKAKRQAERAAKKGGLDGDEPKEKKKKTREDGRDGGDDLDGNFDLSGSDEDASGDEDGEEEASEESESDDGETALDDKKQMTKAFKKEANKMAAELDAGKKRLRKLGILEDGGDVEDSDDDDEDGDDEEDEADDSDDDDEGDDSDSGDEDEYLQMERMRKELEKRGVDTKQFLEGAMRGEGDDDDEDDEDEDDDEEEETEGEEDGAPTEAGEEKELSDDSDAELSDDSDSESWPSDSETDGGPEAEPKQAKAAKPPPPPPPAPVELPFTFPMPETPEALEKIVGHLSADDTDHGARAHPKVPRPDAQGGQPQKDAGLPRAAPATVRDARRHVAAPGGPPRRHRGEHRGGCQHRAFLRGDFGASPAGEDVAASDSTSPRRRDRLAPRAHHLTHLPLRRRVPGNGQAAPGVDARGALPRQRAGALRGAMRPGGGVGGCDVVTRGEVLGTRGTGIPRGDHAARGVSARVRGWR